MSASLITIIGCTFPRLINPLGFHRIWFVWLVGRRDFSSGGGYTSNDAEKNISIHVLALETPKSNSCDQIDFQIFLAIDHEELHLLTIKIFVEKLMIGGGILGLRGGGYFFVFRWSDFGQ